LPKRSQKSKSERQIRKCVFRLKFLSENLYECEDDFDTYSHDFQNVISEINFHFFGKKVIKNDADITKTLAANKKSSTCDDHGDNLEAENIRHEDVCPPWMKKAYKKIAIETHPDKIQHLRLSNREKEERELLYIRAGVALDGRDACTIVEIATYFDINLDINNSEIISYLDERCLQVEKSISDIQQSVAWLWFNSNEEIQINILDSMCKSINESAEREILATLLKKINNKINSKPDRVKKRKAGERPAQRMAKERPHK